MKSISAGFTATDLIAAASGVMMAGGYQPILRTFPEWDTPTSRLFEDDYNVVGIVVLETCRELLRAWPDLQGSLVEVISRNIGKGESKSWDGYLVLLTPEIAPSEYPKIEAVRYDTTRLRKLVATGDDLKSPLDAERVLLSLLPLGQERGRPSQESALDLLPELLADQGISKQTTCILIDAFRARLPLMERLHKRQGEQ